MSTEDNRIVERALATALLEILTVGPLDTKRGICANVDVMISVPDLRRDCLERLYKLFSEWPRRSTPMPKMPIFGYTQHTADGTLWVGEQRDLRLHLLAWCINQLRISIDGGPKQECPVTGQVTDVDPADMGGVHCPAHVDYAPQSRISAPVTQHFVNQKTRMCRMLHGHGPDHDLNVKQALKDGFTEVTADQLNDFREQTAKARAAGWKPEGRTSYAKFLEKQARK